MKLAQVLVCGVLVWANSAAANDNLTRIAEACSEVAKYVGIMNVAYGPGATGRDRLDAAVELDERERFFRIIAGPNALSVLDHKENGIAPTVNAVRNCFNEECAEESRHRSEEFEKRLLDACREDYLAEMEN